MGGLSIHEATYARVMSRLARHAGMRVFRIFHRPLEFRWEEGKSGLDYRLLPEGEVVRLSADASLGMTQQNVRAAYARGDVCLGAFDGQELVAYCWFAFSRAPHMDHAWVEFPPDVVYTYKSYVVAAYRGRGIAATLYRYLDRMWLRRGRTRAMLCVESHNFASIAAARRAGFSASGFVAYFGGHRLRAWHSGRVVGCGMRFFAPAA